jgi:hypothetical protein
MKSGLNTSLRCVLSSVAMALILGCLRATVSKAFSKSAAEISNVGEILALAGVKP